MFEGTAKRLVVARRADGIDLRALGDAFWHAVVASAGAQVLSRRRGQAIDAYLLSESSLFVWSERVLLITCGTTRLVEAAPRIVEAIGGVSALGDLRYERKNEVFPQAQPTSFSEDARLLGRWLSGTSLRLGPTGAHHVHAFHLGRPSALDRDTSVELVMSDLSASGSEAFAPGRPLPEAIREVLRGFEVDQHHFDPQGYSLNALRGDRYAAIHVTPQTPGSYASFETNAWTGEALQAVLRTFVGVLEPSSCDVITWGRLASPPDLGMPLAHCEAEALSPGSSLQLASYLAPSHAAHHAPDDAR